MPCTRAALLLALAPSLLAGCKPKAVRLEVRPPSLRFTSAGNVAVLQVAPQDASGAPVPLASPCAFFSSSPSVADARQDGTVRGLATGSAEIRVTCGALSAAVPVEVSLPAKVALALACDPPACAVLTEDPLSLRLEGMGASGRLTATPLDDAGHEVPVEVRFEVADAEFQKGARPLGVEVSPRGEIRATGVGRYLVLAQAGGAMAKALVEAQLPVVDVVQAARGYVLRPGAEVVIGAKAFRRTRKGLAPVAGSRLVYSSSNAGVARVSDDGRIKALGTGNAEILVAADTGTASPAFAQIEVRVVDASAPAVRAAPPRGGKPGAKAKPPAASKRK